MSSSCELIPHDDKFEAIRTVLSRFGSLFPAVMQKLEDELLATDADMCLKFDLPDIGVQPCDQLLSKAARLISSSMNWVQFAHFIQKIDIAHSFGIFAQNSEDADFNMRFIKPNLSFYNVGISVGIPSHIAQSAAFKRALLARKLERIEGFNSTILCENHVDEDVEPRRFNYVKSNVYTSDVPPGALVAVVGCSCIECSELSNCCPNQASVDFPYNPHGRLKDINRVQAIYECTSMCECPVSCPNRVVQKGLRTPLLLFKTANSRGWGVKTLRKIKKGEFVIEYVGEVISKRRSAKIDDDLAKRYLFNIDFNVDKKFEFVINAFDYGNLARFINSRCEDANLISQAVYVDCVHRDLPRIAFFARREIAPFEELTFDYFDGLPMTQPCFCRSPFCRQASKENEPDLESEQVSASGSDSSESQPFKPQPLQIMLECDVNNSKIKKGEPEIEVKLAKAEKFEPQPDPIVVSSLITLSSESSETTADVSTSSSEDELLLADHVEVISIEDDEDRQLKFEAFRKTRTCSDSQSAVSKVCSSSYQTIATSRTTVSRQSSRKEPVFFEARAVQLGGRMNPIALADGDDQSGSISCSSTDE